MENMSIYQQLAQTPSEARKTIGAGRLKGFTDINPMWRIKRLTEVFGPFGIGWYYVPKNREFVPGANGEIACFVDIDLFYKQDDKWSEAIPGNGGSMLVAKEHSGLYTSDEAVKMATTDAIGSACKLLGMSSDIYFEKDRTKYNTVSESTPAPQKCTCRMCNQPITGVKFPNGKQYTEQEILETSRKQFGVDLCYKCITKTMKDDKFYQAVLNLPGAKEAGK